MTLAADPPATPVSTEPGPRPAEPTPEGRPTRGASRVAPVWERTEGVVRWLAAVAAALVVFTLFLVAKGADPLDVYRSMWESASADGFGETFLRATPFLLAGLAVAVPARAGLFNIGGEGQLLMGAIGAMAVARQLGDGGSNPINLALMCGGGAIAGAGWAGIPAVLRVALKTNEAITSLLLNYTAGLILTWLVFEPWKDPQSLGQAYSEPVGDHQVLPVVWGNRVHAGIFIAALAAVAVWLLLRSTRWGFRLRVLGGNPEAARRAGFAVGGLTLGAMVLGGALAGLGGAIELAGVERSLRPDLLVGFGFIGFLASWLVRHDPLKLIGSSFLLAAIAVGGTGLKISSGLSGAAVNILMALALLAVLGWGQKKPVVT
jgi:simple sugar transport system permease protein